MLQVKIGQISLKSDGSEREIIRGVNFELSDNRIFTILGKNGTGKSTLIKATGKLLNDNIYDVSGSVIFNGSDIYKLSNNELLKFRNKKFRYVFQDSTNSFDHLKTFAYYFNLLARNKEEIDSLLEYFLLPNKEKLFRLYPYEVSGGMAQRISFVLALLSKPELIILDEPTSGIDSAIANLFLLKLKEFAAEDKNSVLLVTQDISFAERVSDKIAYLADGTLSEFFTINNFFIHAENEKLIKFLEANTKIENG